jgi:hypothetical protein
VTIEQTALQIVREMLISPYFHLGRKTQLSDLDVSRIEVILALEDGFELDFPDRLFDRDETTCLSQVISYIEECLTFRKSA